MEPPRKESVEPVARGNADHIVTATTTLIDRLNGIDTIRQVHLEALKSLAGGVVSPQQGGKISFKDKNVFSVELKRGVETLVLAIEQMLKNLPKTLRMWFSLDKERENFKAHVEEKKVKWSELEKFIRVNDVFLMDVKEALFRDSHQELQLLAKISQKAVEVDSELSRSALERKQMSEEFKKLSQEREKTVKLESELTESKDKVQEMQAYITQQDKFIAGLLKRVQALEAKQQK